MSGHDATGRRRRVYRKTLTPLTSKAASEEVGVALRVLARRPRLFGRRSRRRRRIAKVRSALGRFGEQVPHLQERGLSSVAQVDPEKPELGAAEAQDLFHSGPRQRPLTPPRGPVRSGC